MKCMPIYKLNIDKLCLKVIILIEFVTSLDRVFHNLSLGKKSTDIMKCLTVEHEQSYSLFCCCKGQLLK